MIKSKIFVRFALLGTLISVIMLIVSIFTTQWMRDLIFDEPFRDRGPFRVVIRVIDNMQPSERVQGLMDLVARNGGRPMGPPPDGFGGGGPGGPGGGPNGRSPFFDFILLSSEGTVLFPERLDDTRATELQSLVKDLSGSSGEKERVTDRFVISKLSGAPTQYLARGARFKPPMPPLGHFILLLSVQMVTILFAVFLTLGAVLFSIRRRASEAEQVIRDLSSGNLKARIPITKMDEVGQVMFSFNKMADEIEHLIEHLRKTEHARRDLLRELAHDLRTPVASLKSLIETVNERADVLPPEKRRELLDLAMREADYFESLVDDLLFLGRVQEPKYKTQDSKFELHDLIRQEIEGIAHRHPQIEIDLQATDVSFDGDAGLMKRLVRNAIENAVSFAKSDVVVKLTQTDREIEITISDDGPGFDQASLASFGQRKYSRAISNAPSKRISIGLGSVIMKSITDAYRGELIATNRHEESTRDVLGANVSIRLPKI